MRTAAPQAPSAGFDLRAVAVLTPEEALRTVGSRHQGLTTDEADARLRVDGPNTIPEPPQAGAVRRLLSQFTHFFARLLWGAAILAWIGGMPELSIAIVLVVLINGVFSFVQEERAERATKALASLLPQQAVVRRNGIRATVPAEDLVRGDVVLLREGDRISADARLLRTDALRVDMSTLTGESLPVNRDAEAEVSSGTEPVEARSLVFAGTYISSGSGRAVVVATGPRTRLGGIAGLTGSVVRRPTPLRLDLDRAVRLIGGQAVLVGVVFFGVSIWLGMTASDGFLFAVGVIVALVPEGLLPTLTLSLAMSATRMAHRRALVRHLEAVETLGATTVICSDKTGTMTTNQMTVREIRTAAMTLSTTAYGWTPGGTLERDGRPAATADRRAVRSLLAASALCGNARLQEIDGRWTCLGDPTEGALLALAAKGGVDRAGAERETPRVREFPFGSERRRMSTVHRRPGGDLVVYAKGSPESIISVCATVRVGDRTLPLDEERRDRMLGQVDRMAATGLRVLAIGRRVVNGDVPATAESAERDLELLGLVGLEDPVRPSVPDAIARCRRAGIRVLMVTGDHPSTAKAVAAAVGLDHHGVLLGIDLPPDDDELAELLADEHLTVLARVLPEQKLRIAAALQANGQVVAMTGDGVNDAPALRRSDIGVAMGLTGSDVAREAADLVLLDDDFTHIVEAIEEGRAAFDNIRRFLTYHLTDNVSELAPFVVWALSAGKIPLMISVLQVLALDIGTDLLPALALGAERPGPRVMRRPPRKTTEHLLNRSVLLRAFGFLGPVEATLAMLMLPIGAALLFGWSWGEALPTGADAGLLSSMVFSAIVVMQMANALECRSTTASLFTIGPFSNRLLLGAIGVELVLLLAFVLTPTLARFLGGEPMTLAAWGPVVVTPFVFLALEELRKVIARGR
jgi:magnesium-transporting ATPase (P-type)